MSVPLTPTTAPTTLPVAFIFPDVLATAANRVSVAVIEWLAVTPLAFFRVKVVVPGMVNVVVATTLGDVTFVEPLTTAANNVSVAVREWLNVTPLASLRVIVVVPGIVNVVDAVTDGE